MLAERGAMGKKLTCDVSYYMLGCTMFLLQVQAAALLSSSVDHDHIELVQVGKHGDEGGKAWQDCKVQD